MAQAFSGNAKAMNRRQFLATSCASAALAVVGVKAYDVAVDLAAGKDFSAVMWVTTKPPVKVIRWRYIHDPKDFRPIVWSDATLAS